MEHCCFIRNSPYAGVMKVFISYSHEDKSFIKKLKEHFEQTNLEVLDTEQSILPGDNIINAINTAINKSDLIIVILSKESNEDKLFSLEMGLITSEILGDNHKKIIPVVRSRDTIIPPFINRYQALNLSGKKDVDQVFDIIRTVLLLGQESESNQIDLSAEENLISSKNILLEYEKEEYNRKIDSQTTTFFAAISNIIISILIFGIIGGLALTARVKGKEVSSQELNHGLAVILALIMGVVMGASAVLFSINKNKK